MMETRYVCNVSNAEEPLDIPTINYGYESPVHYEGLAEAKPQDKEEPLDMPTMNFERK